MRIVVILFSLITYFALFTNCQKESTFCDVNDQAKVCFYNATLDTINVSVENVLQVRLQPDEEYCNYYRSGNIIYSAVTKNGQNSWADTIFATKCERVNRDLSY